MAGGRTFAEFEVPEPPADPVSALVFYRDASSPRARHALVASWDRTVRLYDLSEYAASAARVLHTFEHEAAVLDVCWITESLAASVGLDRRVRLLNLESGQTKIIGKHDDGTCRVRYDPETNLLFSGGWDATVRVWDPFSTTDTYLLRTLRMPDKVFAMDTSPVYAPAAGAVPLQDDTPRLVVAMAGRAVYVYDLRALRHAIYSGAPESAFAPAQRRESSLKFMLRDVRCMPNGMGYATSSVEGRIAVEFFDTRAEAQAQKYAFKCHRREVDGVDVVYPIHAMAFHPLYGTFASAGGDAHCALWDPVAKKRIRQYVLPSPLSAASFNATGEVLALASGAVNLEDANHDGPDAGEVGGIGAGGHGNVRLHIRPALEDAKPKAKAK